MAARDGEDAFLHQGGGEAGVEAGGSGGFGVGACCLGDGVDVAVFGEGDVDESEIHAGMGVLLVGRGVPEALGSGVEPVDLAFLEPVVAAELALIGGVAVRIEEIERHGGVGGGAAREYFEVVVANAFNLGRSGLGERVGKGLDKLHEGWPGEGPLVIVITEDQSVGDRAADEELGKFENSGLGVGRSFAVHLVAGEDYEVGFLAVEDEADEVKGTRISVAFAAVVVSRLWFTTNTKTSGKV